MIPSAKIAIRPRPPPEKRFRSPRIELPPRLLEIALTALELIPGAGMCVPIRYSSRITAVNRIFVRISPTLNAPRIVAIMPRPSVLDQLAGAAGGLDLLAGGLREAVCVDRQRLGHRALGEHLDRHALAGGQALGVQGLQRDRCSGLE